MKRTILTAVALFLTLISCGEQEARRPVQNKKGTFYQISAARAKVLLEQEEQAMQDWIKKDSSRVYIESPYGFWYAYTKGPDSTARAVVPGDLTAIRYQLRDLSGAVLYAYGEVDTLAYRVDRDERIFKGLRDAVKVLRRGEAGRFLIPSSLAYGFAGDGDKIGPAVPVIAELELIDVIIAEENSSRTSNPSLP